MSATDSAAPLDLFISSELFNRKPKTTDHLGEKLALQDIGAQMLDHPDQVIPKLVDRAMQMTGASSAGVSELELVEGTPGIFRWRDLRGELASFEGATTPRDFSPCGVCIDRLEPTLTRHPERYYSWISDAGGVFPEVLLVPLYVTHDQPLGTLWIVANKEGHFDSGHARLLSELASFTGIALAMQKNHDRLQDALEKQEILTREMDHRVNNVFQLVNSLIYTGKKAAASKDVFADVLSGRLLALASAHSLVRQGFGTGMNIPELSAATLHGLFDSLFGPYQLEGATRFIVNGDDVDLGESAITGLALIFHEFVSNAAKHGALSSVEGQVSVSWSLQGETIVIKWLESGGPQIDAPPKREGFGSTVLHQSITRRFSGKYETQWRKQGLHVELEFPKMKLRN